MRLCDMVSDKWDKTRIQNANDDSLWELFHENSKNSMYDQAPSNIEVIKKMNEMNESLEFKGYKTIDLPKAVSALKLSLEDALISRISTHDMSPSYLTLQSLSTLLYYAYGITRDNKDTIFPRHFRTIPSAGALYPLEIFLYSRHIQNQGSGIYHYNPVQNNLRLLNDGNKLAAIAECFFQSDIAYNSSLIIFITALFKRSTFKYGDRGYRFILLEAGHVAQNINLVVNGLGLGCINIGGFLDHRVDDLLGLDGITHSTIYIIAIGNKKESMVDNTNENRITQERVMPQI